MDYKQIAVKNEQKLKQKVERLKILLGNAISLLEDKFDYCIEDVVEELGITSKEYDEVMYN